MQHWVTIFVFLKSLPIIGRLFYLISGEIPLFLLARFLYEDDFVKASKATEKPACFILMVIVIHISRTKKSKPSAVKMPNATAQIAMLMTDQIVVCFLLAPSVIPINAAI